MHTAMGRFSFRIPTKNTHYVQLELIDGYKSSGSGENKVVRSRSNKDQPASLLAFPKTRFTRLLAG